MQGSWRRDTRLVPQLCAGFSRAVSVSLVAFKAAAAAHPLQWLSLLGLSALGLHIPKLATKLEKGVCVWQISCSSELQRWSLGTKWWETAHRIKAKHTTGNKLCYRLTAQIMRWSWLSWHSPDEPEVDHPPREKEAKYSVGGNLSEGGSVWETGLSALSN